MKNYSFDSTEGLQARTQKFAVVIYLPPHLQEFVTPLREQYDPDYRLIASHITVVFPFDTAETLEDVLGAIQQEVIATEPFKVKLQSVGDFYPDVPIIYWQVKDCLELDDLYRRLYVRLDLPLPHKDFAPHVTVGKEISYHRVVLVKDRVASYLPDEEFTVRAVDLIAPVGGARWVSVRTFPLTEG